MTGTCDWCHNEVAYVLRMYGGANVHLVCLACVYRDGQRLHNVQEMHRKEQEDQEYDEEE